MIITVAECSGLNRTFLNLILLDKIDENFARSWNFTIDLSVTVRRFLTLSVIKNLFCYDAKTKDYAKGGTRLATIQLFCVQVSEPKKVESLNFAAKFFAFLNLPEKKRSRATYFWSLQIFDRKNRKKISTFWRFFRYFLVYLVGLGGNITQKTLFEGVLADFGRISVDFCPIKKV